MNYKRIIQISSTSGLRGWVRRVFIIIPALICCGIYHICTASVVYNGFADIDMTKKKFIIIGDTQHTSHWEFWRERNNEETQGLINEIAKREPAFIINLGDLTTRGRSDKHWNYFDNHHKDVRKRGIPYFPVLGNHDYYGENATAFTNFYSRFPHLNHRRWYSFRFHNIGFIMIDSNFDELDYRSTEEQDDWYQQEINKMENDSFINYIIVSCHHSPYTNNLVISRGEEVDEDFAQPFLAARKTIFFFSGHSHAYEHFVQNGKHFIVTGGGGGPRHRLETDPTERSFDDRYLGEEIRFFHFCEIEIKDETVFLNVVKLQADGTFVVADTISASITNQH